jgi:hypothetical protein
LKARAESAGAGVDGGLLPRSASSGLPVALPAGAARGYQAMPMSRFLERQPRRGLPGVYEAVISGHRESPPVQRIRRKEAPEVTGGDSSRQMPITRNEGAPGSSPGVGFGICRDFAPSDDALMKGSGVHQRSTLVMCSKRNEAFCSFFFARERESRRLRMSSQVTPSAFQSGLTHQWH